MRVFRLRAMLHLGCNNIPGPLPAAERIKIYSWARCKCWACNWRRGRRWRRDDGGQEENLAKMLLAVIPAGQLLGRSGKLALPWRPNTPSPAPATAAAGPAQVLLAHMQPLQGLMCGLQRQSGLGVRVLVLTPL